jgi:hypothetical protein
MTIKRQGTNRREKYYRRDNGVPLKKKAVAWDSHISPESAKADLMAAAESRR